MNLDQFRDACLSYYQRVQYPNPPSYSAYMLGIIDVKGYELTVKPKDLMTVVHSQATPGSLIHTVQYAHAQMIASVTPGTYTILTEDGKFRERCWSLDEKPEHWTSIIPLQEIFSSLIPKRKK